MDKNRKKTPFKSCFVPLCCNTTQSTPNKVFIHVPSECKQRKLWFTAVKRKQKPNILKTCKDYCCGDHFDLKNDVQNWMKFQFMPDTPIILKRGVVPHKFDCQLQVCGSHTTCSLKENPTKKQKLDTVEVLPINYAKYTKDSSFRFLFRSTNIIDIKSTSLETTLNLIKRQTYFYIGLPESSYFIINDLSEKLQVPEKDILLCLEKIKRDIGMVALANDFDSNKQKVTQCFLTLVPHISAQVKKYIFWPSKTRIIQNMPRIFRASYPKVESILNCFEINIPEPKTKLKKSVCWSDDRKSYTYKYLISSTPDGMINWVSGSFGGKISDSLMLEVSGFLDYVPAGCEILADGFKNANDLFDKKGCVLRDYPTFDAGEVNRFIALRAQMELVLGQFKMYQFLHPYSYVDAKLLNVLDDVVVIVAGLVNLRHVNK